jgi:hypothetical protein
VISSSDEQTFAGHDSGVRNRKSERATELVPLDEIRRQIAALTDASTQRHRLERGTAEYEAALKTEEQLAARVWRLGTSLGPTHQRTAEREPSK